MADILLIDDEAQMRRMIVRVLNAAGHTVREAADGRVGIELFRDAVPALVITDIVMPDMEGIELIRELRRLEPSVPILAISGGGPALYLRAAIWKRQRLDECRLRRSWSCSTSIAGANKKCRVPLRWRIFGRWWCGWQFLTCSIAINRVDFRVSSRTRSHQKVTIARGKGAVRVPFPGSELCSPDTATAALDVDPRAT